MTLEFLNELEKVIQGRKKTDPSLSYTAKLFSEGKYRIAQKIGEEGVETALASIKGNKKEIVSESADLVFHMMVMLADNDLSLKDVELELKSRHKK